MNVDSPETGFEEISELLKEDGSTLAGELGLNLFVNKKEKPEDYVCTDLASSNDLHVDSNEQGQPGPPSLPSDFRYYGFAESPPENFRSFPLTGFDHDPVLSEMIFLGDQEMLPSHLNNNHHSKESEDLCGSYLHSSPLQVGAKNSHLEIKTEIATHPHEFPSTDNATLEEEMEDRQTNPLHDEIVKETFSETSYELVNEASHLLTKKLCSSSGLHGGNKETEIENIYNSRNSPAEDRKLEMHDSDQHILKRTPQLSDSPGKVRRISVSPGMSSCPYSSPSSQKAFPSQQGVQESSHSSRSHKQRHNCSAERSDRGKEVPSKDHSLAVGKQVSISPRASRRGSHRLNCSSVGSTRNKYSNQYHQKGDRTVLRSPARRKDSSSRHKKDHRDRSRSRSPYRRDHYRRSPRRRHSPRHRSPPSGHYSYRGSPRRPWSPPHNRSTGLGKPGRNLFVAGFSFLTTERDLERKFSRFGHVRDVRIVRDKRSGDSRGFGFLSLERDEEADAAIRALDKTEWNGRIVLVEKSKSY